MSNQEKYDQAFGDSFSLDDSQKLTSLEYNQIPEWDSIGHMELMAALEDAFDVTLDTDDIIEFSSYQKGVAILAKYDVII